MAGLVVPITPMRTYDFSWLATNSSTDIVLRQNIDVREWRHSSLVVRVSACSFAVGAAISFFSQHDGWTEDDPGQDFVMTFVSPDVVLDSSVSPPASFVARTVSLGAAIRLVMRASRGATAGGIFATMSVDLCMKNALG